MKKIGVIGLVVILIIFGAPLLKIKDNYKNMEYSEIGDVMLGNIDKYVDILDKTSQVANTVYDMTEKAFNYTKDTIEVIRDFIIGIFENETSTTCKPNANGGFDCSTSDGGGGGSFGGGSR